MRILHAIHDFLPRHRAGSEVYVLGLCRALQERGHEVGVLCAEYDWSRAHGSLHRRRYQGLPVTELVNNYFFPSFAETYLASELHAPLERVLDEQRPDLLHVHNLLNLSMELPALAARRGIPSVATLHDFTLLCPSGGQRVHLAETHVCLEIDPERCARCFPQSPFQALLASGRVGRTSRGRGALGRLAGALRRRLPGLAAPLGRAAAQLAAPALEREEIEARLARARRLFGEIELFVAPSAALAADFQRFGLPAERLLVSDNGSEALPPLAREPRGARLRIGFVGTVTWHKGVHVLTEAVRGLDPERYELRVFGRLEASPEYAERVQREAADLPVRFEGAFAPESAAQIYAGLDLLVVPSLWPENSPVVVHEAYQAGLPIVAARMGGLVDLVREGESGLLYDAFAPDQLRQCLQSLLDEPQRLQQLAAGLPEVKTMQQDAVDWEARYREVLARPRPGARPDPGAGRGL